MQIKPIVLAFGSLLAVPQTSSAKQCVNPPNAINAGQPRWRNDLFPSEVSSAYLDDKSNMTFGQLSYYYRQVYADTALEACMKLVKYHFKGNQNQIDTAIATQIDATQYHCTYDYNNDGYVYGTPTSPPKPPRAWDDYAQNHPIVYTAGQTEPMCDRIPNGPYTTDDPATKVGTPGGSFTNTKQRTELKQANNGTANFWKSNVYVPTLAPEGTTPPVSVTKDYYPLVYPLSSLNSYPSSYQIDHIIPRVDLYGCACGPNSKANALFESAKLNGEMSNNSQHPTRVYLLDKWTKVSIAAKESDENGAEAEPLDENGAEAEPLDESVDEIGEIGGGCSTGGGSGGGLALLGLGLAFAMRRQTSRSDRPDSRR